jgi:hypothetical protein
MRSLSLDDGADLRLEEAELPFAHRPRTVYGDCDFTDTLTHDTGQIKASAHRCRRFGLIQL